ncbi:hypothetical protein RND71_043435 [Anisodus tanguticus]|uniref:Uncharacterized protein n=1 Tax=Anisodus tanguticus TaxID=243964 RepID=A0AAE1UND1_9SOLA|nr:hypothetical protein RND71_043435 [Anisodus tanguticus]
MAESMPSNMEEKPTCLIMLGMAGSEVLRKEYMEVYRPEYERIKKEIIENVDKPIEEDESISKDSLIEFDNGIYDDSSDEEDKKEMMETIEEENEDINEKKEYQDFLDNFVKKLKTDNKDE